MSAPDIDPALLSLFKPLGGGTHLTILLGAGASAPSGLPDWDEFARRIAVLSGLVTSTAAADILLSRQDQTIVLEAARVQSGSAWSAHLNEALYEGDTKQARPSPLHLATVGHYLASPTTTTVSTLNFDTLLESAILDAGEPLVTIGVDGTEEAGVPTVHHLHGVIFDGTEHGAIIGFRDYAELVADEDAWQRRFLSNALKRGPLLLAGTSYRDPDIRHWLHMILRDEMPIHPAVVTIAREGLGLDREMFDAVDDALASEWEAIGLTALRVQDLTDIALVIRELQFIGNDDYQSPRDRARQVWNAHARHFSDMQTEYSDVLALNAESVSDALGAKALRGTLWLADGHGKLARWASEGTQYRSARYLKLVPTGHDSPWIAGEAIGAEEVKIKDIARERQATPTWRSVLAIPIFVGNARSPEFATAVLTFGLSKTAATILAREDEWTRLIEEISTAWGTRISNVAFPARVH